MAMALSSITGADSRSLLTQRIQLFMFTTVMRMNVWKYWEHIKEPSEWENRSVEFLGISERNYIF